jgi:AcrR family transcriptional regulator
MDGRVRRGERNRQAIVDAALELIVEMRAMPTAQAIAERAGVAPRSVFHHFPDMEDLLARAAETQAARHWKVLQPPAPGRTLGERIADAVGERALLFEAIGDVRRVAVLHEQAYPLLGERLQDSRAALRRHLRRALQPELSALRRPAAEGIQAVASWEAWEVLRRQQGLSAASARAAVQHTIESAFERAPAREV